MQEKVIRSQRILVAGQVVPADLVLGGGLILEIVPYGSRSDAVDLGGMLILPGLVDLHSDAVEKEIEPRPGATFPVKSSLIELDKKLAMSGITTMFHAIAFNDEAIVSSRGTRMADSIIRQIHRINRTDLTVDNLIHVRYEITSFSSIPIIRALMDEDKMQLFSIMDHTPGRGQFKSIESWKRFHLPVYDLNEEQADAIIRDKQAGREEACKRITELLDLGRQYNLVLLSHDDDDPDKIDLNREWGITISEFPLNTATAAYAREQGISTGMGAPNVVRGKSQGGNISARDLIRAGHCDYLCSDYHPGSLLQAAFVLREDMQMDFGDSLAMVSSTPARIAGLTDRGEIAENMLADLIVVDDRDIPRVVTTFKAGEIVYSSLGCLCA